MSLQRIIHTLTDLLKSTPATGHAAVYPTTGVHLDNWQVRT